MRRLASLALLALLLTPAACRRGTNVTFSGGDLGPTISACGSIGSSGTYALSTSLTSSGTCITIAANDVTLNLNGFTITYGSGGSGSGIAVTNGNSENVTIYGGTITESGSTAGSPIDMGAILAGPVIHDMTLTWSTPSTGGIANSYSGAPITSGAQIFNVTFNNNQVGNCSQVPCRDELQYTSLYIAQAQYATPGVFSLYNNMFNGGPQGALACDAPGCKIYGNTFKAGNATEGVSDDFLIYCWSSCDAYNNTGLTNFSSPQQSRGVEMSGVVCEEQGKPNCAGRNVHNNTIMAIEHRNNAEYSGCEPSGAFGISWSGGTGTLTANSTSQNNKVTVHTTDCESIGLRLTDTTTTTNQSLNDTFVAQHDPSAGACAPLADDGNALCAFALGFDMGANAPGAFYINGDTFQGDDAEIYLDDFGANNTIIASSTFVLGANPQNNCSGGTAYCFIIARNLGNPSVFHVQDATFASGVDPLVNGIPAQDDIQLPVSAYIDWTQSVTVTMVSGPPAAGAAVTYTDQLGNNYTATTNSSGVAAVAVSQYRLNNDTAANQVEDRNPFSIRVALSGCMTYTNSGLSIVGTGSLGVTLPGC